MKPIKRKGNFTFIHISDLSLKKDLINALSDNKIFIRDYGHIENTKNYIRITIGTTDNMKRVLEVVKTFDNKVK